MTVARPYAILQKLCLAFCAGVIFQVSAAAQTVPSDGGSIILSKTYDTVVTGNGVGDYQWSFSQWDPSQGKLVAVRIQAQAAVRYGYTLRNVTDSASDVYTITVGRKNIISSPAMAIGAVDPLIHSDIVLSLVPASSARSR